MKAKSLPLVHRLLFCLLPLALCYSAAAQGTAFAYQGRLNNGTNAANGIYDFQLTAWDSVTNGNNVSVPTNVSGVPVTNGLFSLTCDLGAIWTGAPRWLELGVRTNGGGSFTALAPRQPVSPTPYAIMAGSASNLLGTVSGASFSGNYTNAVNLNNPNNTVSGSFTGNGAGVTNVNAATLGGLASGNYWQLAGNNVGAGQFLGSTNNQAVEIRVNGTRAFQLEPNTNLAPNVIGGAASNFVTPGVIGATIAGGGANNFGGTIFSNAVGANFGAIGGGYQNSIGTNSYIGVIGGGFLNAIQGSAASSVIAGGSANTIQTNAYESVIGGGYQNTIQSNSYDSLIAGGTGNLIETNSRYSTIGGGYHNDIRPNSQYNLIAGGIINLIDTNSPYSVVGGGAGNAVLSNADHAVITGGGNNTNAGAYATVNGGYNNQALANYSTAAGYYAKATNTGAFVWADNSSATYFNSTNNNEFAIRATGGVRLATGGAGGTLDGVTILTGSGASALAWQLVSGTSVQAQPRNGYLVTNTVPVSVALPTNSTPGDIFRVSAGGAGWRITQAANQSIRTANLINILGTNGAWSSTGVANGNWRAISSSADGSRLVAAPGGGVIIYSTNGGVNWVTSTSPSSNWVGVASSADGAKVVAVSGTGYIFSSANYGASWTPLFGPANWTSVASSANGNRLYAATTNGAIYFSSNSGAAWFPSTISGQWMSLACSASGLNAVAGFNNGSVYTTSDGGVTWTQRTSSPNLLWQALAMSASGGIIAGGSSTAQIYISRDAGVTWSASGSPPLNCHGLSMSTDGNKLLACGVGVPLMTSQDGGGTWQTNSSSSLAWYGTAGSSDGGRLAAVVFGGSIYTLQPGAAFTTTVGANGYLLGGPGTAIELQYVATNLYQPISHEGSIYAY